MSLPLYHTACQLRDLVNKIRASSLRREKLQSACKNNQLKDLAKMRQKAVELQKELEKIKYRIDIAGVVLVEESVLFQAGKDGVFTDTDIVSPFLDGDNFSS